MGIFDDIGGWISGAARDIYDTALKPIGNAIASGATTVWNGGVSLTNRAVNFTERVADGGLNFLEKEGNAVNDFSSTLSNPFFMIGALIAAVIILPKIIK